MISHDVVFSGFNRDFKIPGWVDGRPEVIFDKIVPSTQFVYACDGFGDSRSHFGDVDNVEDRVLPAIGERELFFFYFAFIFPFNPNSNCAVLIFVFCTCCPELFSVVFEYFYFETKAVFSDCCCQRALNVNSK